MPPRRWPIYLVGTPRGRLSKLEKQFLERPWGQVKQSVEVKLLPREGELYILARSERSEEHTSELQSRLHLVCRLLLEKKNNNRVIDDILEHFLSIHNRPNNSPNLLAHVIVRREPPSDHRTNLQLKHLQRV